ncbi:unnamed protein product, partial [Prorocentrum cordatum]
DVPDPPGQGGPPCRLPPGEVSGQSPPTQPEEEPDTVGMQQLSDWPSINSVLSDEASAPGEHVDATPTPTRSPWKRGTTAPPPLTSFANDDDQVEQPQGRMRWQTSMPAQDTSEEKGEAGLLEGVLATCEERLAGLRQSLQLSGPTPEWRAGCQTLGQVLEDLAAEALDAACRRGAGAMDVFEGASNALNATTDLIIE